MTKKEYIALVGEEREKNGRFKKGHKQLNSSKNWFQKGRKMSIQEKELLSKRNKEMNIQPPHYKGKEHWNWKGGKKLSANGYVEIHLPTHPNSNNLGYVMEHRLVMEKNIGRYLLKTEIVHHLNGIKTDNKIENLELLESASAHNKIHNKNKNRNNSGQYIKNIEEITGERMIDMFGGAWEAELEDLAIKEGVSGLVPCGKNSEGEQEYIGTKQEWDKYDDENASDVLYEEGADK